VSALLVGTGLVGTTLTTASAQAASGRATSLPGTAGSTTAIAGWQILSSASTSDSGGTISSSSYSTSGWMPVSARSTVLSGLLQNGKYPNVFYSNNLSSVSTSQFQVPWWYRENFTVNATSGLHTILHLDGVNSAGDVYVNGSEVSSKSTIAGANAANDVDITSHVHTGSNAIAIEVQPSDPSKNLAIGFVDWNPKVPDGDMGIWQDVTLHQSAAVLLQNLRVTTSLASDLSTADVTVKVDATNKTSSSVSTTVSGSVGSINYSQNVTIGANATTTVTFNSSNSSGLHITSPKVWWPAGMGSHPLYTATVKASVGGNVSDTASTTFGIRSVKSGINSSGARYYTVNGKNVLIRGGGWSPDMFLRSDPSRLEQEFQVITHMGLNAIRQEGKLETPEFYNLADQNGIMLLPGWECCDKWQSGSSFSSSDYKIAQNSMLSVARRIENHPSVITFLIGSDEAPPSTLAGDYQKALQQAGFPDPVVSSADAGSTSQYGAGGMKMNGPYDWIPPNYWYGSKVGAAYGFDSETSAGPSVPELDSLNAMMTSSEQSTLYSSASAKQFHAGLQSGNFGQLTLYNNALNGRYGSSSSIATYDIKAQLQNYENSRAEYESRLARMDRSSNPATGVIYWMMNNAWPSLIWNLFGYDLAPNGDTYGAQKANEPVHVLWQYDSNNAVTLDNISTSTASGLSVTAQTYSPSGTQLTNQTKSGLSVSPNHTASVFTLTKPSGVSGAYLIKLTVKNSSGSEIDRNVYWWSTTPDVVNWSDTGCGNCWYYTPTSQYANLKGLFSMSKVPVSASASTTDNGDGTFTTKVTLKNTTTGKVPAFFVESKLRDGNGKQVAPVFWSDNDISLWPGESKTLSVTYKSVSGTPQVQVSGVNVSSFTVQAALGTGGGGGGTPASYEAESSANTLTGAAKIASCSACSGGEKVGYVGMGATLTFNNVNVTTAGTYKVTVQYCSGNARSADISANGGSAQTVSFPVTGSFTTPGTVTVSVSLKAGANTITFGNASAYAPDFDKITVPGSPG